MGTLTLSRTLARKVSEADPESGPAPVLFSVVTDHEDSRTITIITIIVIFMVNFIFIYLYIVFSVERLPDLLDRGQLADEPGAVRCPTAALLLFLHHATERLRGSGGSLSGVLSAAPTCRYCLHLLDVPAPPAPDQLPTGRQIVAVVAHTLERAGPAVGGALSSSWLLLD